MAKDQHGWYSPEEKMHYIEEYFNSGLSLTKFCDSTFYDNPVYIYEFSETRKTDKTEELFKDYKGYLVCDKYAGYDKFKDKLLGIQRCMAHAKLI